jgi:hypothetical protein
MTHPTIATTDDLEKLIEYCGDRFRKLTLHSENPKHPNLIWQATPNQHTSKFKRGVRGTTARDAVLNLIFELDKHQ